MRQGTVIPWGPSWNTPECGYTGSGKSARRPGFIFMAFLSFFALILPCGCGKRKSENRSGTGVLPGYTRRTALPGTGIAGRAAP